jgi:hypothetical protein
MGARDAPDAVIWFALFLLNMTVLPTAPIAMLLALPFARRTGDSVLPGWLAWLNTPDDPGPMQGMYEPQVAAVRERFGWLVKTWYWLGIRNQCYGLFAALCGRYNGAKVSETFCWKFKIYSVPGYREITWPGRRVSFGYKVQTLKTAKAGDPIWWVCQPSFWKAREY